MHVGALPGRARHVLARLLGHVALQHHAVQRPLVLAGHLLHDGRQEGLRVEEAGQPDGGGQLEVGGPRLQLLDAEEQVGVPQAQGQEGRVGAFGPRLRHRVQEERVGQRLHVGRDGQLALQIEACVFEIKSFLVVVVVVVGCGGGGGGGGVCVCVCV